MFYNVAGNTFDLFVTVDRYSNPMTDSHVQEATAGETGPALIHFGAESVYTRNGSTVTASFLNRPYPGNPLKLIQRANNTTGIALIEAADLRTLGGVITN